jgi:hypothetical protein
MRTVLWAPILACACGSSGGGGVMTATVETGGAEIAFEEGCSMPERDTAYNIYASGGDPHLGFDAIWDKTAITGPGTYPAALFGVVTFYVEHEDPADPSEVAISDGVGTVTFTTYEAEAGHVAGTFEIVVEADDPADPPFLEATGAFECRD